MKAIPKALYPRHLCRLWKSKEEEGTIKSIREENTKKQTMQKELLARLYLAFSVEKKSC